MEALSDSLIEDYIARLAHRLFDAREDKIALIFDGQFISYAEVGERVLRIIAGFEEEELRAGMVLAVCLGKSPDFIYTVLACTLMGVIWLPIDMDSPVERTTYLLANSGVDRVITQTPIDGPVNLYIESLLSMPKAEIEGRFRYRLDETPAYYLYTSGSTGTPKCVVLNHRATANVLQQTIRRWNITEKDCVMAVTPFHHDMSVFDIFATLSSGATLVLPSQKQQKDAQAWIDLVAQHHITIWVSVPAIVDMLFTLGNAVQLRSLRLIAQGGDYIKPSLLTRIRSLLPNTRLFSLGGPTETTIWSIWYEIRECDVDSVPYGEPLVYNHYYILNEQLQPCAIGEVGKMYMSGINLSNGYLKNGRLIKNDFLQIRNERQHVETVFRMSDLGYVRDDGLIIFAGREEGYLKIKGVRISAVEVENTLAQHPSIKDAIVVSCSHPGNDLTELVALYTKPTEMSAMITKAALKEHMSRYLPYSHIPTKWLCIECLPLTANGKVDRNALTKKAKEHFFPSSIDSSLVGYDIGEVVLNSFKGVIEAEKYSSISERTELSTLSLRPQQLMTVTKKLSDVLQVSIEFYKIAKCRTLKDVIIYLNKQGCAV
ncbi:peptide synthetase [Salinivibrio sp. SS3]|nr:peptide synthetase [Salinivibrio sp. BNH]